MFKEKPLHLKKWGPEAGRLRKGVHAKEVWVTVVGLSLHLWSREVFKKLGNCCGVFVAMDEDTAHFSQLQWAKVLVKADGRVLPNLLQVVDDLTCFAIQLWYCLGSHRCAPVYFLLYIMYNSLCLSKKIK